MGTVTENLKIVENKISAATEKSGRKRSDVLLVAVTKTHPPDKSGGYGYRREQAAGNT